jgi:hypothetical protein
MIARARFLIAVFGISLATFLMTMQGSLLYGYTLSTSALIDAIDADLDYRSGDGSLRLCGPLQ